MPGQLRFGPFFCCYGISLCNPDYDYQSILDELLILTNRISKTEAHRYHIIQCLLEMFLNVEVSYMIVDIL